MVSINNEIGREGSGRGSWKSLVVDVDVGVGGMLKLTTLRETWRVLVVRARLI